MTTETDIHQDSDSTKDLGGQTPLLTGRCLLQILESRTPGFRQHCDLQADDKAIERLDAVIPPDLESQEKWLEVLNYPRGKYPNALEYSLLKTLGFKRWWD